MVTHLYTLPYQTMKHLSKTEKDRIRSLLKICAQDMIDDWIVEKTPPERLWFRSLMDHNEWKSGRFRKLIDQIERFIEEKRLETTPKPSIHLTNLEQHEENLSKEQYNKPDRW